jgi:arylsulfatase A-like enzyme
MFLKAFKGNLSFNRESSAMSKKTESTRKAALSECVSRRGFLSTMAASAAIMLTGMGRAVAAKKKHPNVLFIASDDLNDWVGYLGGHPDTVTPNIDALAARGLVFERAYCNAPICNPSRASLMTGLRPSTTGVYENRHPFRESQHEITRNAITFPMHLRKHGYFATGSGKIFHGKYPDPVSWDTWFPALNVQTNRGAGPPHPQMNRTPELGTSFDWGPLDVEDKEMADYKSVEYCIGQLQKKHDRPFFLACGIQKPHLNWHVPRKYFEKFDPAKVTLPTINENDLDDVPPIGVKFANPRFNDKIQKAGKWREAVAAYLATIHFVDAMVGRLIDALNKSKYAQDTIIVFWGDHGWHLAEKLHWKKSTLWEEGTRTPWLFVVPGMTKPGGRCKRPVSFIDMYPTIVDLCGVPPKSDVDGKSLVPLLKDPGAAWETPVVTTHKFGNHSVRSERWRYIRYKDGTEELYDHDKDELEWTNLAGDPKYTEVKEKLACWLPKTNMPDSKYVPWPGDEKKKAVNRSGEKINAE